MSQRKIRKKITREGYMNKITHENFEYTLPEASEDIIDSLIGEVILKDKHKLWSYIIPTLILTNIQNKKYKIRKRYLYEGQLSTEERTVFLKALSKSEIHELLDFLGNKQSQYAK